MKKPMPDLVTEVAKYRQGWTGGLPETPCGYGSRVDQTAIQREWIPKMVGKYGLQSIADIGAGDLNWIGLVEWPHKVDYQPYDLVPRATGVKALDIIHEQPEPADLGLCLWVLNHLPEEHARAAVDNLLQSCQWLMYTWEPRQWGCTDLGYVERVIIRERKDTRGSVELRLVKC